MDQGSNAHDGQRGSKESTYASIPLTVWRSQILRRFVKLVNASYCELAARDLVDKAYSELLDKLKQLVHLQNKDDIDGSPKEVGRRTKKSSKGSGKKEDKLFL